MRKRILFLIGGAGLLAVAAAAFLSRQHPSPRAVILIVVDTLRADRLAAWGAERSVMPRLDARLERAVVFERAAAPSPWTLPSFASLYTGLYPARHGAGARNAGSGAARAFTDLSPDIPVLAEILREEGWITAALATNRFLSPKFGLARGFATYDHGWVGGTAARRADGSIDEALEWIEAVGDTTFFLSLHVFDPHLPYDPPPSTRGRFTGEYGGELRLPFGSFRPLRAAGRGPDAADRAFIASAYDEEVAFVDEQLGRFLDALDERGTLERAVVLLTSDHGEEFWEHGGFEHGHTLYEELLRVPLAVWAPGLRPRRIPEPVSLVDLMPTVLDAAEAPVPDGLDGVSLWAPISGRGRLPVRHLIAESPLYAEERRAVIRWPWKLVEESPEGRTELYDLEVDPGETRDLSSEHPDVVERLAAGVPRGPAARRSAVELEVEDLDALRALGYVE